MSPESELANLGSSTLNARELALQHIEHVTAEQTSKEHLVEHTQCNRKGTESGIHVGA